MISDETLRISTSLRGRAESKTCDRTIFVENVMAIVELLSKQALLRWLLVLLKCLLSRKKLLLR